MTGDEQDKQPDAELAEGMELLDDELPPEIPDISSDPPPSSEEAAEPIEPEPMSSPRHRPVPPPKPSARRRVDTAPQTPIARSLTPMPPSARAEEPSSEALRPPRPPSVGPQVPPPPLVRSQPPGPSASSPPRPVSEPPRRLSEPPRPVSEPPRPVSEPPRRLSEPPRPVSEPPRPVSEPPRAVSEPPRPVSEPPRPVSEPPRPVSEPPRAISRPPPPPSAVTDPDAGAAPLAEIAAAVSVETTAPEEPGRAARQKMITIPDDSVPDTSAVGVVAPATAIMAMRIITVGEASEEAPPEFDIEVEPPVSESAIDESAEELADEDVAPDSDITDVEATADSDVDSAQHKRAAPPPPPRRASAEKPEQPEKPKPAAPPRSVDARSQQRRPWWEELFSEDFVRANYRTSDGVITREVDFIEESLGVAPGGVVLDLGCGEGHHAVELASRGYGVVGYDLSLHQLALAADVAQDRGQKLNFLQGDMREMAFEEMFDGIYCWNTTFGYFEEEKNAAVAQRVFKALKPGGMFLLDVVNRDFVAMDQPNQLWYEGDACVCMDDMSVDFITSRLRVKRNLILDDGRTRECNYSVRLYALHELGKLLHDVGFRVTEASGHPTTPGVFFGTCSPRIIILAQRP